MNTHAAAQMLATLAVVLTAPSLWAAEPIDLTPSESQAGVTHVTATLEVGGEVLVPVEADDPDAAPETQRVPMSVAATLQYDERRLPPTPEGVARAARYYRKAHADIKVDDGGDSPTLADDRRLILVEVGEGRASFSAAAGLMDREQVDLLDVAGNSLVLDRLLPTEPVADGATWNQDAPAMAPLLCLDSVDVCEVQSILEEANAQFAKVRLAGVVHGTADGAATKQEVRGVYLFDREARRISRFNLAIKEERSVGAATRGLDAVSNLKVIITDADPAPAELDDRAVAALVKTAANPLVYDSTDQGLRLEYDRQWFITDQHRESITLCRVADGDLVAQCTISRLPSRSAGRQTSLEQFEKDIRYSLGERFGAMVSSRQWINAPGHYCYEVVVRGQIDQLPIEWHYYLVSPVAGHRATAAVTIEGPKVERLGRADRELIENLQLLGVENPPADTATRPTGDATR